MKGNELTVRDLVNRFLTSKKSLLDSGELSPRTWSLYYTSCEHLVGSFGKTRLVGDLSREDFEKYRAKLAKTRGPRPTLTLKVRYVHCPGCGYRAKTI